MIRDVDDLIGDALDWAVAHAMYLDTSRELTDGERYSTDPKHCVPVMEANNINVRRKMRIGVTERGTEVTQFDGWLANVEPNAYWMRSRWYADGPTIQVAVMRCFVKSKCGNTVDLPERFL